MSVRQIPRSEWIDFCRSLTLSHTGRLVTVETGGNHSLQPVARDEPLKAVSAELEAPDGGDKIVISTGANPLERTFRAVRDPVGLALEDASGGLRIESRTGEVTTVRFGSASTGS
jgi:hypothetical protein